MGKEGVPSTPLADLSTRAGKKGRPRELDRWISINRGESFIQAEIKASCAGGLGLPSLALSHSSEEVRKFAAKQYRKYFGQKSWFWREPGWRKLQLKMQPPDNCCPDIAHATLLLWVPTSPCADTGAGLPECYFDVETPPACADSVYYYGRFSVFSASLYCRYLLAEGLVRCELELPLLSDLLQRLRTIGFLGQ